jgi:hypothetical protein
MLVYESLEKLADAKPEIDSEYFRTRFRTIIMKYNIINRFDGYDESDKLTNEIIECLKKDMWAMSKQ